MAASRTLRFKAMYWAYEESDVHDEENDLYIHIGGITTDLKSVHVIVTGFTPYVYLELPKRCAKWSMRKCRKLFRYFQQTLGPRYGPIQFDRVVKQSLYKLEIAYTLQFTFHTPVAARKFFWNARTKRHTIPGLTIFRKEELKVHEHKMDPIIQFTANQNLLLAGWLDVTETVPEKEDGDADVKRLTTADIDMYVNWKDVKQHETDDRVVAEPTYCSFDIECYSKNHNSKLPDPNNKANAVFQVSCVFGRLGEDFSKQKRILLTLFNPHDLPGVETRRFASEKLLLLGFTKVNNEYNPDIFIGYNIMKFDWHYLITRAKLFLIQNRFIKMSRIIGKWGEIKTQNWSSSAYGEQHFQYLECRGRTNVDVLLEVERNYRLPTYSLNAVSEKFLGDKKDDITPRQLFMLYQITQDILHKVEKMVISADELQEIKYHIRDVMVKRKTHGVVKTLRKKLLRSTPHNIERLIRQALTITGKYCVQDTILPVALVEKLNLWTTMEEMANVVHVPISYLHTRGQQIRVLAQVYRAILPQDIIIPFNDTETKGRFQGAIVVEANPGDYIDVGVLDFASLYPTTMIAFNICYTTILDDDDPTPDEECHILEWEEHSGCPHDHVKRKTKIKVHDILCGSHRYRFRRVQVVIHPDGRVERKYEGVLPRLERSLLAARKQVKKELFKAQARLKMHRGQAPEDELADFAKYGFEIIEPGSLDTQEEKMLVITIGVLDAKQKALKVSANSMYGAMGVKRGQMPFIPGAASVTAMGRKQLTMVIEQVRKRWKNCNVVYGDSVTGDTPILYRYDGDIYYDSIQSLPGSWWMNFRGEKSYSTPLPGLEVWTENGFTPVRNIIRHKTKKRLFRITTHTGSVTVTEDHSLLDSNAVKIKPKDLSIGSDLLITDMPEIGGDLEYPEAWAWGLFYGDGSCGIYDCPSGKKCSWAINNLDLDFLRKAQKILSEVFPEYKFPILNTVKSSGVYKLSVKGNVKKWVHEWRAMFYNEDSYKKVPDILYQSSLKTRQQFFDGYYAADGDKDPNGYTRFCNKGQIGAAGLFLISTSLGYKVSINTRKDKLDIYRLTLTKSRQRKPAHKVKKIEDLGITDQYVYDLETESHHFAAGVGRVVVHNTDSVMIKFEGCNTAESFDLCKEVSAAITHYLKCWIIGVEEEYRVEDQRNGQLYRLDEITPKDEVSEFLSHEEKVVVTQYDSNPIDLEFENMYGRFLLLTKKRYIAYIINRLGKILDIQKKGVVLARRDNCQYLRDTYQLMVTAILDNKSEEEVMDLLYQKVDALFSRSISDQDLVIYVGIKGLINYAKTVERTVGRKTKTFIVDINGGLLHPDEVTDPRDSRLIYPNLPQVLLAKKMLGRGTDIPPNTRLEFIYLEKPDAVHQGEKAEDFTYYWENKLVDDLRPDLLHYIKKQLTKPITELLTVKYPRPIVPYEKLEDALDRVLTGKDLGNLILNRLSRLRKFTKPRPEKDEEEDSVGWGFYQLLHGEEKTEYSRSQFRLSPARTFIGYKITRVKASKVEFILKSYKEGGVHDVKYDKHQEIVDICLRWKARDILNRAYRYYGMKKKPAKRPSQTGNKLRIGCQIILKVKCGKYRKGDVGQIIAIYEDEAFREKDHERYTFDIIVKTEDKILQVPRRNFTTFRFQDSIILKDIWVARVAYQRVVNHLQSIMVENKQEPAELVF